MTGTKSLAGLDWIAADWGTTSLRVFAMDTAGNLLDRAASDAGMGKLKPEEFEPALLALVGAWLAEDGPVVPVIVIGMAGARQGWQEAPYRTVPCPPVTGDNLCPVDTKDLRISVAIVPGLSQAQPADVMRGEETQIAGLIARGVESATVCLPGTHSKWVRLDAGTVTRFATVMTGELFAIIGAHSILRHSLVDGGAATDDRAFLAAVDRAVAHPENMTAELFSIRARGLLENQSAEAARATLSGLLIGAELAGQRALWENGMVHLIGADRLIADYAKALSHLGSRPVVEDATALTIAGLTSVRAGTKETIT